jgi:hypothetical protein
MVSSSSFLSILSFDVFLSATYPAISASSEAIRSAKVVICLVSNNEFVINLFELLLRAKIMFSDFEVIVFFFKKKTKNGGEGYMKCCRDTITFHDAGQIAVISYWIQRSYRTGCTRPKIP